MLNLYNKSEGWKFDGLYSWEWEDGLVREA